MNSATVYHRFLALDILKGDCYTWQDFVTIDSQFCCNSNSCNVLPGNFNIPQILVFGSCNGRMVGMLGSILNSLGLSPGWVIALCFWARHFTLTVPLTLTLISKIAYSSLIRQWYDGY